MAKIHVKPKMWTNSSPIFYEQIIHCFILSVHWTFLRISWMFFLCSDISSGQFQALANIKNLYNHRWCRAIFHCCVFRDNSFDFITLFNLWCWWIEGNSKSIKPFFWYNLLLLIGDDASAFIKSAAVWGYLTFQLILCHRARSYACD